jgi:histidinol-phosphate/aromatic aminotransferase/cobyric acid decarboxylase-like protein
MAECTQLTWGEQQQLFEKGFVVRDRHDGPKRGGEHAVRIWVAEGMPMCALPAAIQRIMAQPDEE